jgi:hypothetical protein
MRSEEAMMHNDEETIHVTAHERSKPMTKKKSGLEIENVAPNRIKKGVEEVSTRGGKPTNASPPRQGVQRVGGGDHGRVDKGVEIFRGNR